MSEVTSGSWTGRAAGAASVGHKSPCVHAVPKRRVHRPFQSRTACSRASGRMQRPIQARATCSRASGRMRRRLGLHATAAAPACATILAIMPTSIEPTPAGIRSQDALPAEVISLVALPIGLGAVA